MIQSWAEFMERREEVRDDVIPGGDPALDFHACRKCNRETRDWPQLFTMFPV